MQDLHTNKQYIWRITFDLISKGADREEFLFWLDIYDYLDDSQKKELHEIIIEEFTLLENNSH